MEKIKAVKYQRFNKDYILKHSFKCKFCGKKATGEYLDEDYNCHHTCERCLKDKVEIIKN